MNSETGIPHSGRYRALSPDTAENTRPDDQHAASGAVLCVAHTPTLTQACDAVVKSVTLGIVHRSVVLLVAVPWCQQGTNTNIENMIKITFLAHNNNTNLK